MRVYVKPHDFLCVLERQKWLVLYFSIGLDCMPSILETIFLTIDKKHKHSLQKSFYYLLWSEEFKLANQHMKILIRYIPWYRFVDVDSTIDNIFTSNWTFKSRKRWAIHFRLQPDVSGERIANFLADMALRKNPRFLIMPRDASPQRK